MRHLRPTPLLLAGPLLALPLQASDLAINGQDVVDAPIGSQIQLTLDGGAGLPAFVALDVSPGPVTLFGESVGIGLTPAFQVFAQGSTDAGGSFGLTIPIASQPNLVGTTLYLVGALADPGDPNGLDFSDTVQLTFTGGDPVETQLFGVSRSGAPHFEWVTTAQMTVPVEVAVDPAAHPQVVGVTADVYVVADKDQLAWSADPTLIDLTGDGPDTVTFSGGGVAANRFQVDSGTLNGDNGAVFGVAYDLVVDLDRDGKLSAGDLIDGRNDAGMYVVIPPTQFGPYGVVETTYSGGSFLGQNLFYPAEIDQLSSCHLVVVSHGNGHNYLWYDHIGTHLASWGYVVMSHENNTVPGVGTASTTTLTNTEYFLANLDLIAGGALDGKIVRDEIVWIGHSRGGEGIVRAYDKLIDDVFVSPEFDENDIALLSSIAPTVFFDAGASDPHDVDFSIWVGAGDADVTGCVSNGIAMSKRLFGRAVGQRQAISLYGVGHGWFHNGTSASAWITGPCQLDRPKTHAIMRGYLLPLVEWHVRENPAAKDFLRRQYEDLRPLGVQTETQNPCTVVNLQYTEKPSSGKIVIESMQGDVDALVASSGVPITYTLDQWVTRRAGDRNSDFSYDPLDPMNGMTYGKGTEEERAGALRYVGGTDQTLTFDLGPGTDDWSAQRWLSFRAGQSTRSPLTVSVLADLHIGVRLVDTDGDSAELNTLPLLAGLEEPYQRTGCGSGAGWVTEMETVRMGLDGFRAENPALDLDSIDRLEFLFGPSYGEAEAQLVIDDIEVLAD
jgi:hypothetical protein